MSGWVRHDYVRCYNANSSRSVWGKRVEKFDTNQPELTLIPLPITHKIEKAFVFNTN